MASRHHGLELAKDLLSFTMTHKKWWLFPIVAVSLLLAGVVALSSSPAAPFLYTLF